MASPQRVQRIDPNLLSAPTKDEGFSSEDDAELQRLQGSSPELSPSPSPPPPSYAIQQGPPESNVPQPASSRRISNVPEYASSVNPVPHGKPQIVVFSPEMSILREKADIEGRKSPGSLKALPTSSTSAMSTMTRPKSPKQGTPNKKEENESFWDKLGTIGRKKKVKEVQEFQTGGQVTIDLPGSPYCVDVPSDDYNLGDNEERSMIQPHSLKDPRLRELVDILIDWLNDELASQRIIVKHMEEDLYDGMVLHKLLEKLTGIPLDVPEVTQSEEGQKQKLRIILNAANHTLGLGRYGPHKWSVESIHSKNLIPIIHLLVALARHFRAPIRLPENVIVQVVIVQKRDGQLNHRIVEEELTGTYDDLGLRCERDAFDTLFDKAPEKLQVVKRSLVTFVNKQLNKVNLEVFDLENDFSDGVYLCLLMGLLEGYFVPLHFFHLTPKNFDERLHNVSQSFELMMDAGLPKPKARPEDIVNKDLKSTLRVLYNLFTKYKNV